jgi:uncharacterized membrane protein YkvA (DUF1232 family)
MPGWLVIVLIGVAILVASWVLLIVLARRLPAGTAKDLASFLPDCVRAARRLRRDPRVPRRAKFAVLIAAAWVISPIDLIPEFIPVIGPLDDVIVVALALRYAARQVPEEVLFEAWSGSPDLLRKLIGSGKHSDPGPPKQIQLDVELLVVPDCRNGPATAALLRGVLDEIGLSNSEVRTTVVRTQHDAEERGFVGSPTIFVNGIDPFAQAGCRPALACRIYLTPNGPAGIPDPAELRRVLQEGAAS